jgi:hypothetical protein
MNPLSWTSTIPWPVLTCTSADRLNRSAKPLKPSSRTATFTVQAATITNLGCVFEEKGVTVGSGSNSRQYPSQSISNPFISCQYPFLGDKWRGLLARWRVGALVYWRVGVLARWCIGALAHWEVEKFGTEIVKFFPYWAGRANPGNHANPKDSFPKEPFGLERHPFGTITIIILNPNQKAKG